MFEYEENVMKQNNDEQDVVLPMKTKRQNTPVELMLKALL